VVTWIAPGCRVNTNKSLDVPVKSCFFVELPQYGRFYGLSAVDEATGQGILSLEGWVFPADKEQACCPVEYDCIHRQQWCLGPFIVPVHAFIALARLRMAVSH
jgi:hypothetical protein